MLQHAARVYMCNGEKFTLQHTATHCKTLQHTANTLQHAAKHCQHTATRCNTLQHTARVYYTSVMGKLTNFFEQTVARPYHITLHAWHDSFKYVWHDLCIHVRHDWFINMDMTDL